MTLRPWGPTTPILGSDDADYDADAIFLRGEGVDPFG
jgi:hypothetical protein